MPEVKTATTTTPPTAAAKYQVVGSAIYLGTEHHAVGDLIELTPSQAQRLGSLVTPASPASAAKPAASGS